MDQRNSIKINAMIGIDYSNIDGRDFDKKLFGKKIKLLFKTFNKKFKDDIDIENFKNVISIISKLGENARSTRLARKIFYDYQIFDICLENIDVLGKEYFLSLYDYLIPIVLKGNNSMQNHRNIIDICKKGYNETGFIECYYHLANIIYKWCWCCCRPTNANKTAYKYYNKCLDSGYITNTILYDMGNILNDFIENKKIEITKKEEYYEQLIKCYEYVKDEKYTVDTEFYSNQKILKSYQDAIILSSIELNKKDFLDKFIENLDLDYYNCYNLLCWYYKYPDDYFNFLEKTKDFIKDDEFLKLMINVNFSLNNYSEMILYITQMIDKVENINQLPKNNYTHLNCNMKYIVKKDMVYYIIENFVNTDIQIFIRLIDCYENRNDEYWKLFFILFFDKIINSGIKNKKYFEEKINSLNDNSKLYTDLATNFGSYDTKLAIKFIDGIVNITNYLIEQKNNDNNENYDIDITIQTFIKFLGKITPFCSDQIHYNNISNPFFVTDNTVTNKNTKKGKNTKKDKNKKTTKNNTNSDDDEKPWDVVFGEDSDYDTVYTKYSDYYNALYGFSVSQEFKNSIIESNNLIKDKLDMIKDKLDMIKDKLDMIKV